MVTQAQELVSGANLPRTARLIVIVALKASACTVARPMLIARKGSVTVQTGSACAETAPVIPISVSSVEMGSAAASREWSAEERASRSGLIPRTAEHAGKSAVKERFARRVSAKVNVILSRRATTPALTSRRIPTTAAPAARRAILPVVIDASMVYADASQAWRIATASVST